MSDKPSCKWFRMDLNTSKLRDRRCTHPLAVHLCSGSTAVAKCYGCPCHEPAEPVACQWTQDWEGNWEATCGLCWGGDDIGGMNFCPNCGRAVAETPYTEPPADDEEEEPGTRTDPPKVHDKP